MKATVLLAAQNWPILQTSIFVWKNIPVHLSKYNKLHVMADSWYSHQEKMHDFE